MPIVINRSNPSGGGNQPDKKAGNKANAASPSAPAKGGNKSKGAASKSIFDDQRVKIGGLALLIVVALLLALFSLGVFNREPAAQPIVAPAPGATPGGSTINAPAGGGADQSPAGSAPGRLGQRRSGPGMAPGSPIPGGPGNESAPASGARLPGIGEP